MRATTIVIRPPRKYFPVWQRLKTDTTCMLEVPNALVPRVRKAIIKEKDKDVGFKFANPYEDFKLTFEYQDSNRPHHKIVTIKLTKRIGIFDTVQV